MHLQSKRDWLISIYLCVPISLFVTRNGVFSSSFCFCCCISQITFSPRRPAAAAALALISAVTTMSHFNYSTTITTAQWLLSECHSSGLTGIKSYICICHFIRPPSVRYDCRTFTATFRYASKSNSCQRQSRSCEISRSVLSTLAEAMHSHS